MHPKSRNGPNKSPLRQDNGEMFNMRNARVPTPFPDILLVILSQMRWDSSCIHMSKNMPSVIWKNFWDPFWGM